MSVNAENLLAVQSASMELNYLGRLLWFTIPELKINYRQLHEAFINNNIDCRYLPKPISPRDAFRRAAKMAEHKKTKLDDRRFLNLLVREIPSPTDKKRVIKQLVREIVDSENVRLEYLSIVTLMLEDDYGYINTYEKDYLLDPEKDAVQLILDEFEDAKKNYNAQQVRYILMDILNDCQQVAVRPSGGVYFLPEMYAKTAQNLKGFIQEISGYCVKDPSCMYIVPVVDVQEQRQMVNESLQEQVKTESNFLIKEISDIIKSGRNVSERTAGKYIDQVKALKYKVKEYEVLLETEVSNVQSCMALALEAATKLLERAGGDN